MVTGDGPRNAREGLRRALESVRPARVLVVGVAGGLAPDLPPGSLVVGRRVVDGKGSELEPDEPLTAAITAGGARRGVVVTVSRIVDTPESKAALRRSGPDVVDLESACYATEAERASLPWAVLRVVSDAAGEGLPSYLEGCRDARGAIRRGAVARGAVLRPWTIPTLLRLRRRVREGAARLADAVEAAVARTPAPAPAASEPDAKTR